MTNDSILVGNPCKPFTGFYLIVLGNPANTSAIDMISLLVKPVEANFLLLFMGYLMERWIPLGTPLSLPVAVASETEPPNIRILREPLCHNSLRK